LECGYEAILAGDAFMDSERLCNAFLEFPNLVVELL
jgi:hypothetical protein